MPDDFSVLNEDNGIGYDWLGDNPAQVIRNEIERILKMQNSAFTLEKVRLTSSPRFAVSADHLTEDPNLIASNNVTFAVPCEMQIRSEKGLTALNGIFSWVAVNLDTERVDRAFLDIGNDIESSLFYLTLRRIRAMTGIPDSPMKPNPFGAWWEFWRKKP